MKKYMILLLLLGLSIIACQPGTVILTLNTGTGGSVTVEDSTGSVIEDLQSIPVNTEITLRATAEDNHQFTGWDGDYTSTDNPLTFTITEDTSITANFGEEVVLTVNAGTGGSITAPDTSSIAIIKGYPFTITAEADTGYNFVNWTTTDAGVTFAEETSASTTVTLSEGGATITANFEIKTYQLTLVAGDNGSITTPDTSTVTVNHGEAVSIVAEAYNDYVFYNWTTMNAGVTFAEETSASTTVTLLEGDATITANFVEPVRLTVYAYQGGKVIVTFNGSDTIIDPGTTYPSIGHLFDVAPNVPIPIRAEAEPGYELVGWEEMTYYVAIDDVNAIETTVTVNESGNSEEIKATFDRTYHNVEVIATASEGTITTPASSPIEVRGGESNTITVVDNDSTDRYEFYRWTSDIPEPDVVITNADQLSASFVVYNGNPTITAEFLKTYEFSGYSDLAQIIKPSGTVTAYNGVPIEIEASPYPGYRFKSWSPMNDGITFEDEYSANTYVTITDSTSENVWVYAEIEEITEICVDASYTGTDSDGSKTKPFKDIQSAMDEADANHGPDVWVALGEYEVDSAIIMYKSSLLGGYTNDNGTWTRNPYQTESDRSTYLTKIEYVGTSSGDYTNPTAAVLIKDWVTSDHILEGFTIIGGNGNDYTSAIKTNSTYGSVYNADIRYNTINGGNAVEESSGIHFNSSGSSKNFVIENNVINGGNSKIVNGVYSKDSLYVLKNNIINAGTGENFSYGVRCEIKISPDNPFIHNNIIDGGESERSHAVFSYESSIRIENNILNGGNGTLGSYGVFVEKCNPEINNNTIIGGRNTDAWVRGIYLIGTSLKPAKPFISNNIITCPVGLTGYGIYEADYLYTKPNTVSNNDIYDCSTALYRVFSSPGIETLYTDIADVNALTYASNNVSVDPVFVDEANEDYHLYQDGSPGGTPSTVFNGGVTISDDDFPNNGTNKIDIEGNERLGSWSIGAYEFDYNP